MLSSGYIHGFDAENIVNIFFLKELYMVTAQSLLRWLQLLAVNTQNK